MVAFGWTALCAGMCGLAVWWWFPVDAVARLSPDRRVVFERLATAALAWVRALPRKRDAVRADALRASAPKVCSLLAVCLDAGSPPRAALREVAAVVGAPAGPALVAVVQRIDVGLDEAESWLELGDVPGYRDMSRDMARAIRSGLGLADLLRHHAREARRELANAELVKARGASVRGVVPLMVCFLPAFLALGVFPIFGSLRLALPFP